MLTPYGPGGLLLVTDRDGHCVAVIDPVTGQVVRAPGGQLPLAAELGAGTAGGALGLLNRYSGVFPSQGSYAGGTLVTIIGSHFSRASAVYFGARPAASFAVLDDQTIVAVTPSGSGAAPVTVTTPGGTARVGYFSYLYWPSLSAIVPAAGPVGGGNVVTLRGANLSTAQLVHFGDAVAFPLVVSDAQLLVTAPPVPGPGPVPVYVSSIGGVSNRLLYTYAAAPSVSGVSPAAGPIAGGNTVVLTGTGLAGVTGVTIGGLPATSFRAYLDTLIVAVTPAGVPGPADITVTTPGGSATLPAAFDYMAPSATEVTSDPDPALVGQPVTFTAAVTAVPPTTGTPSGTVTFDFGDATAAVTAAVTDGTATVSHAYTGPSGSPYAVSATYSGDVFFTPSTGTDTQVVEAAPTTTTVAPTPAPSLAGQSVTFVARVAPAPPGAGVPTGTVTFDFGDGTPPVTLPVSGGAASVTHAYAHAAESPYPVTATYDGDDHFTPSTGTGSQTVQQASTSTTVDLSPNPSVAGQPVTVTASATSLPPGAGTPTGTVTFDFGDGTTPVTAPLTDGSAGTTHTFGATGSPYAVTATYNGDDSFTASTGTDSQTVGLASSSTAMTSTPDPSTVGQQVTFTATVTTLPPGSGTPTGTVTFDFGDTTTPVTMPLTDGAADTTHTYTDAADTPYTVTATYNGDAHVTASAGTDSQTVGLASSSTAVTSTPDPSTVGQQVTFTATVTTLPPGSGTPTGTVTFDFGDGSPTTTALLADGATDTSHSYTDAAGSPYTVTATYNGDANVTTSAGTDSQTVQPADTTVNLDAAPDPSTVGQSTTFVAKIAPEAPAAGAPTGTVTFEFGDDSPPVTAPVEGGTATVTHTNPDVAASPYTVAATYSGDDNFNSSAGADTQVVTKAVSTTVVSAAPASSMTGQAVAFTAVVAAVPPAAGTPTGTVTFDFGDGTTPVTLSLTDGTAGTTHAFTSAAASPYAVTLTYSGDTNFLASAGTDLHVVEQATTVTTVTAAPDPSVTGESVRVTVTPRAPGAGVPTGQAVFDFGDGSPLLTAQLEGGTATVVHAYTSTAGSPYTIAAHYSGDADFAPSDDTIAHAVAPAATTTVVTSSGDPAAVGQSVTLIARVRPVPPGAGDPTGTVTFDFGDGTVPATAPVSNGLATAVHAYAGTAGSPYTVTAAYSGDADFAASSGTAAQRVDSSVSTTSTTVSSAPDPSTVGEPVTFTAVVVAVPPASGTPTGTVTFDFGDGTTAVSAPLVGGTATAGHLYTTATNPASVTAVYHGDTNFAGSAGLDTQTVSEAASSTALTSSADPSATGEPVTFTATVATVDAGAGTPTGSVAFDFGDGSATVRAPLADGTATAVHAYTGTSGSPYAVTADYDGDGSFTGSTGTDTQTVHPAATSTTVFSSPDPSTAGQPVTITASLAAVSPGSGRPPGTVTFDFGDGTPTVTTPAVAGLATVTHAYTTTVNSPFSITASYSGAPDFAPSAGTTSQTVLQSAVTLAVSTGPNPTVAGEPVTVTATATPVPPGAGVPTGTVTVDFGDGTAPTTESLAGGAVHLTHTYASVFGSPYTITATYNGSEDFSSAVVTAAQTVLQDATTTTVAAAPDPSVVGQPVTFTASVKPVAGGGSPTGTVTFDFGDGTVPVAMPVVAGVATVEHAFSGTSGSPYAVTAAYSGDTDFTASGDGATQSVDEAPSVTAVTSSPDPSVTGQPVTVTATVSAAAPGDGSPTGTVTFDFGDGDGSATVTAPVSHGVATAAHTWAGTSGSPSTLTAGYSGDTDFTPSTGIGTHTVAPATTTTAVDSSPDPSVSGQAVTVTAAVTANAPGDGVPTGTVTFDFGDGSPAVTAPLTDGVAGTTHVWPGTSGSPYPVTATYGGDPDFAPSTGSDDQSVTPATTTITVSGLPEPSVTGQPVTFFARVTPDGDGDGTPTGTVTYNFGDGTTPVVAPVTDGVATAVHAYPPSTGSPFTVTATYSGDDDFLASVAADIHTVQPAVSTTVVSSSPDPSVSGQPVTVTATVSAEAPGDGTPSGTVTFDFGDGSTAVTAPVTDGTASTTHVWSSTSGSPYTLTATYSGDAGFTPSRATGTKTVTAAATTTAVASSTDPSVPGRPVTLTATVSAVAPGDGSPTGTVTFTFGDGTPAVTTAVSAGTATLTHAWAGTAGSPYPVTADYSGDPDFSPSTGTGSQTVGQGAAGLTLFSSPDPSVAGQEVTFTARVTAVPPGAGAPTGTVTFDFGDGTAPVTAPVSGGVAALAHTYAAASDTPYPVTAAYSGDTDFAPATVTEPHTVSAGAATTSTTVSSAPDPTVTGQQVTFTATVAPTPPGAGVPTGTAAFDFGDGTATITAPVSGGVATVTHTYVSAAGSPYTVTAHYSGDANFSSSSGTDIHTVAPASTLTTVTTAPDPSVTGQPVTLTATVAALAPGAGVPTDTVTFDFGDGTATTSAPVSGGVARVTHTYTSATGPLTVTALYDGDASFLSSSATDTQTVNKAATTTAVVSSPDPTVVGQVMTITASVASAAPGTGTPTGTVTFDFGDGTASVTTPVAGGPATVTHTYTATAGSPYPLTATYNGDANYTSSSGTDTQTVNKAATTTAVVSSPDPTVVGQTTTVTATVASVAPGTGTPTGTVTFDFGDGSPSVTAPVAGGQATVTHPSASSGPYTLTATYNGDANYTSSSGSDTQTVNKAATATALVSSPDPTVAGQSVTLTATVTPVAPGAGTPTGTVTFSFGDGTGSTTATLSGGLATVTHTYTTTSGTPYPLTATYNGDANYTSSSGSDTQTVNKAATATALASSPDPGVAGQPVTLTATVPPVAPGAGTPTGTVTFSFGDGTGSTTATLSGGLATVTHTYTTASTTPYPLTATYNGGTNFITSGGSDTQTVNKAATATAVTSTPDPSAAGQAVTVTAAISALAPGAGTPTGTVTFSFGDGTSSTTAPLSGGLATVSHTYATKTGSPFPLTAAYNGDASFTASSGATTHTVNKNLTTTTVTSSPDPAVVGQPVTLRATVSSGGGTPTGTVTFSFGDGTSSVAATLSGGVATVTHTYTTTTGSPFTVTATYGGEVSFTASSGTDTQTVNKAATTTTVVSTPNPSTTGDRVTVTATVVPVAPGAGTPSGTVTLAITGRTPQTVTLVGGTASVSFSPLPKGSHSVTGNYNGDVSFAGSTGITVQTVV